VVDCAVLFVLLTGLVLVVVTGFEPGLGLSALLGAGFVLAAGVAFLAFAQGYLWFLQLESVLKL
jgi:hypothetical protein